MNDNLCEFLSFKFIIKAVLASISEHCLTICTLDNFWPLVTHNSKIIFKNSLSFLLSTGKHTRRHTDMADFGFLGRKTSTHTNIAAF